MKIEQRCQRCLALVLLLIAVHATASGESSLSGVVTDPSGTPMLRVTVRVKTDGLTVSQVTNEAGAYRFVIRAGTYHVSASISGLGEVTKTVVVDGDALLDFRLLPGEPAEPVTAHTEQSDGRPRIVDVEDIDWGPRERWWTRLRRSFKNGPVSVNFEYETNRPQSIKLPDSRRQPLDDVSNASNIRIAIRAGSEEHGLHLSADEERALQEEYDKVKSELLGHGTIDEAAIARVTPSVLSEYFADLSSSKPVIRSLRVRFLEKLDWPFRSPLRWNEYGWLHITVAPAHPWSAQIDRRAAEDLSVRIAAGRHHVWVKTARHVCEETVVIVAAKEAYVHCPRRGTVSPK